MDIKTNPDLFFEGGFEFSQQSFNKLTHPSRFEGLRRPAKRGSLPPAIIVLLAVADEDLSAVFIGHRSISATRGRSFAKADVVIITFDNA